MRICICTGAYRRHELFDLFCDYYAWLQKRIPFELVVACSEVQTNDIAQSYGHTSFIVNNHPLTRKFNMAAQYCEGADYTIMLGSDDFLSEKTLMYYVELFERGIDYIYTLDWFFYNSLNGKALLWEGYTEKTNRGDACGAGRALSKNLMDKLNWTPWASGYDKILDTGMDVNLAKIPHTKHGFRLNQLQLCGLDIKSDENMTPFAHWPNTIEIKAETMLEKHFPEWKERILSF